MITNMVFKNSNTNRNVIFILLIAGIVLVAGCTQQPSHEKICGDGVCEEGEDQINCPTDCGEPQTQELRTFYMGFVPIPKQPLTTESWLEAFDLLGNNAEFVLHHANFDQTDWEQFAEGVSAGSTPTIQSLDFINAMADQNGLDVFIVMDPLIANRESIANLPTSVGTNFGDENVRQAFKNFAIRVVRDYRPAYMGMFSEVNTYMEHHPEDADNVVSLYKETYDLIKQESPTTKITTTFQYEALSGMVGEPQWEIIDQFETKLDVVGITTYPSLWFETPGNIPDNYYSQIRQHTPKSVIVAESGWPTGGALQYHGSEENQEAFVRRFVELTEDIDLELWIWWFLHDWEGEGYADFFKTMGLRMSAGQEKSSWSAWHVIHELPKI